MGKKLFAFKDNEEPAEYRREIVVHLDTSISKRINIMHEDGKSFVTIMVNDSKNPYYRFAINKPNVSRQEVVRTIIKSALYKPYETYIKEITNKVRSIFPDENHLFKTRSKSDDFSIINPSEHLPRQLFNVKSSILKGKGSRYSLDSVMNASERTVFNVVNVFWKDVFISDKIEVIPILKIDTKGSIKDFNIELEGTHNIIAKRYIGFSLFDKNYLIFNGVVAEAKDRGSALSLIDVAGGLLCFSTQFEYKGAEIMQQPITKEDKIKEYQNIHKMFFRLAEDLKENNKISNNPLKGKEEGIDISM